MSFFEFPITVGTRSHCCTCIMWLIRGKNTRWMQKVYAQNSMRLNATITSILNWRKSRSVCRISLTEQECCLSASNRVWKNNVHGVTSHIANGQKSHHSGYLPFIIADRRSDVNLGELEHQVCENNFSVRHAEKRCFRYIPLADSRIVVALICRRCRADNNEAII